MNLKERAKKLKTDISECLDESQTKIPVQNIEKIIFCYSNGKIPNDDIFGQKEYLLSLGVKLELVSVNDIALDIDELAADESIVTEIDKDNEYTKNNNARIAVIDLSDFNSGDEIMVTVRAIAGISAENYIDGIDGNGKIVRISDRLPVPDISKLVIDESIGMSKEESDAVNGDEYSLGYYVNYTSDEQYAKYQNVSVNMAIAVFDEKTEENSQKANSGDGFVNSWNDGAIATMYAKKTPLDMGYVPTKTPVRINLSEIEDYPGQYAGKWLKIAVKATSASRIASKWTDEDAADETDNYLWIHIPDLQLDDVEATETTDDDVVGTGEADAVAIDGDAFAGGCLACHIEVVGEDQTAGELDDAGDVKDDDAVGFADGIAQRAGAGIVQVGDMIDRTATAASGKATEAFRTGEGKLVVGRRGEHKHH